MKRPIRPFWENVDRRGENDCWPWLGYKKPSGHGLTQMKSMPLHAHRKAWILTHGDIPRDLCVNHRCDNAACCNPAHLYLGTRADNMIDLWLKTGAAERRENNRRTILTEEQLRQLWYMRKVEKKTLAECGRSFGVHLSTIARYITAYRRVLLERRRADRSSRFAV